MKIARIEIQNYRSISELVLDGFKDVNLFIGKNNTGKTTFLQALYSPFWAKLLGLGNPTFYHPIEGNPGVFHYTKKGEPTSIKLISDNSTNDVVQYWEKSIGYQISGKPENGYYIKADRGYRNRNTSIIGKPPTTVGFHGEGTNRMMVWLKQNEEEKFLKIRDFMETIGIEIKTIDNYLHYAENISQVYTDLQTGEKYDFEEGGFGQTQVLPLIVQAIASPKQSCLFFEEPEISLDPGAQHKLLLRLIDLAIEQEKQIFISTHSYYFIRVLENWLSKENTESKKYSPHVSVYNVERMKGETKISQIKSAFRKSFEELFHI